MTLEPTDTIIWQISIIGPKIAVNDECVCVCVFVCVVIECRVEAKARLTSRTELRGRWADAHE